MVAIRLVATPIIIVFSGTGLLEVLEQISKWIKHGRLGEKSLVDIVRLKVERFERA